MFTCRSIPPIRRSGSPPCWRTAAPRCFWFRRNLPDGFPILRAQRFCSTIRAGARRARWRNLPSNISGESAAYILYTSGSTAAPKGVVAPHRGALNRFAWMWEAYPFHPGEKIAQKTSLSFVDSIWEMFGALLRGVPTVVVPDAAAKDPVELARWLARRRATRLVVVPSLLRELIDQADIARSLRALRYCFSSGEALPTALAVRFRAVLPSCRLINLYGSSEVAGDIAYYEVEGGERALAIPIGRPIANSRIYLLDDGLEPVPIGARGEIYVGGDNLARGYLDPRSSAEKFVADPFSGAEGARLYRTGDLGRYRADGNIEFLGRRDRQIKIRGVRIEPGEVEAALASHPAVQQCLLTAQAPQSATDNRKSKIENPKSNHVLVAYVVSGNDRPTTAELRLFLKERLPDSMIPAAFVFLDALPLLPNGKVDLGALPSAGAAAEPVDTAMNEPRTEFERLIAAVWSQVLGVPSGSAPMTISSSWAAIRCRRRRRRRNCATPSTGRCRCAIFSLPRRSPLSPARSKKWSAAKEEKSSRKFGRRLARAICRWHRANSRCLFSASSSAAAIFSTCLTLGGSKGGWMWRRCAAPSRRSCGATKRSAPVLSTAPRDRGSFFAAAQKSDYR